MIFLKSVICTIDEGGILGLQGSLSIVICVFIKSSNVIYQFLYK